MVLIEAVRLAKISIFTYSEDRKVSWSISSELIFLINWIDKLTVGDGIPCSQVLSFSHQELKKRQVVAYTVGDQSEQTCRFLGSRSTSIPYRTVLLRFLACTSGGDSTCTSGGDSRRAASGGWDGVRRNGSCGVLESHAATTVSSFCSHNALSPNLCSCRCVSEPFALSLQP